MALLPDLVGRIRLDMSELNRAQGEAQSRGAAIGSALGTAVGSLAGGLLAEAGQRVMEFVTGSVDQFARLQDATQAAGVVFGDSLPIVQRFADGAAKSLGMSKEAAISASLDFATYGKQLGLTGNDLAGFSTKMATLAGDMASFRGTSPEEAITALGAAFRGEYDPIEKYGVSLSAAKVKAEALRMGLKPVNGELTDQQKVLATQSLILQQTTQAQGDFARSADGVANSQKTVKAETENAQAALGEKLAPAYLTVLQALNQVIGGVTGFISVISDVIKFLGDYKELLIGVGVALLAMNARMIMVNVQMAVWLTWQSIIGIIEGLKAAWWGLNAAMAANPIGAVIAVLALLAAGLVYAYNHSETFRNAVNSLWAGIQAFVADIPAKWEAFRTAVVNAFTNAYNAVQSFIQFLVNLPGNIAAAIGDFAGYIWNLIVGAWTRAKDGVVQAVQTHVQEASQFVSKIITAIGDFAKGLWDKVVGGWNYIKDGVAQANQYLFDRAAEFGNKTVTAIGDFNKWLTDKIVGGWIYIRDGVGQANQFLFDRAAEFGGKVVGAIGDFAKMLWDKIVGAWNALPAGIRQPIEQVVGAAANMARDILNSLANLPGQMVTMGHDIINGLLRGLQELGPQIVSYLTNLIPEPVRNALNIHSPSGVMKDIGEDVMRGLDQGLQSWIPKIQDTLNKVMDLIKSTGKAAGEIELGGQKFGYSVEKTAQGISGSATVAGQKVSGSYNQQTGQLQASGFGQQFNIDARSFGSQLDPKDVVNQILWKAKAGGLVPA